jgi:hypothetical protein
MNKQIFCNASLRPNCILNTNLCCLVCSVKEDCYLQCGKVKPCDPTDYDENEPCEFLI